MLEVWLFIKAVFNHWYTLVGGCLLIVALGLWERYKSVDVPPKVYWSMVASLLLVAFFLAWSDERHKAIQLSRDLETAKQEWTKNLDALKLELEQKSPKFTADIDMVSSGYSPEMQAAQVFILIAIRNLGAPSIVENYKLHIKSSRLDIVSETPVFINPGYKLLQGHRVLAVFGRDDNIMEKTIKPIEHNGIVRGWLRYVVPEVSNVEDTIKLREVGLTYTVTFHDVAGRPWTAIRSITGEQLNEYLRYPGATMPFKSSKK